MVEKNKNARRKIINGAKRIVVKVGTRLLTSKSRIAPLITQIEFLREKGHDVMLVSSGAVGIGMKTLKMKKRPSKLSSIQGLAAIGQSKLMSYYEAECSRRGFHAAQLLLTADDLQDRERHLNVLNCINSLWAQGVLPIVNENDSVSVDELKFGDNDFLAGLLAVMTRSELTIILTTVDGFHEKKSNGELGKRISLVSELSDELKESASGTDSSTFSIGGMISKLRAAEIATSSGESLWIADGREPDIIKQIINAEDVGTLFMPKQKQVQSRKRWIGIFSKSAGKIKIDEGAAKALSKDGRSLLPSGISSVSGSFERGDTVDICTSKGKIIAKGLSNFSDSECKKIAGLQSSDIVAALNNAAADEVVVHRNNLFLTDKNIGK
jgi:glutamate 5-kinase